MYFELHRQRIKLRPLRNDLGTAHLIDEGEGRLDKFSRALRGSMIFFLLSGDQTNITD